MMLMKGDTKLDVLPETQSCNQHCFRNRDNRVFALDTHTCGAAARLPVGEKNPRREAVQNRPNS